MPIPGITMSAMGGSMTPEMKMQLLSQVLSSMGQSLLSPNPGRMGLLGRLGQSFGAGSNAMSQGLVGQEQSALARKLLNLQLQAGQADIELKQAHKGLYTEQMEKAERERKAQAKMAEYWNNPMEITGENPTYDAFSETPVEPITTRKTTRLQESFKGMNPAARAIIEAEASAGLPVSEKVAGMLLAQETAGQRQHELALARQDASLDRKLRMEEAERHNRATEAMAGSAAADRALTRDLMKDERRTKSYQSLVARYDNAVKGLRMQYDAIMADPMKANPDVTLRYNEALKQLVNTYKPAFKAFGVPLGEDSSVDLTKGATPAGAKSKFTIISKG